jgi:hypothetical protein
VLLLTKLDTLWWEAGKNRHKLQIRQDGLPIFTFYHSTDEEALGQEKAYRSFTHRVHVQDPIDVLQECIYPIPQGQEAVAQHENDPIAAAEYQRQKTYYRDLKCTNGTWSFREEVEWLKIKQREKARRRTKQ